MKDDTKQILEWIATEIVAGKSLAETDEYSKTWNAAHDRALSIIAHYKKGEGLFQLTSKSKIAPKNTK